jgi:4-hydroxy-tetrahydrodipicolinate synthase
VLFGGHGGVNGGANLFPRLYVALYEAAVRGDVPRVRELQTRVHQVAERLYYVGKHPSTIIKGIKCAAACLGLCQNFMAEPFHRFREPERRRIQEVLSNRRDWLGEFA